MRQLLTCTSIGQGNMPSLLGLKKDVCLSFSDRLKILENKGRLFSFFFFLFCFFFLIHNSVFFNQKC